MTTIELYGDHSGYIGCHEMTRREWARGGTLAMARLLARQHADHLSEPVEARVITPSGSYRYGVRHVPGVTSG